ncbi:MAG: response regulator [Candidatus Cloacimonetes bacterium]|nr:response regulator [Candidatus Cloacimonadota bacterium]
MKKTILLVEPNRWARKMIVNGLKGYGYKFIECEDGQQAENILFHSQEIVSLIITELRLKKLSGYDLIRKVKLHKEIPVIVQSECSQKELILECMKIGVTTYLKKPTRLISLKQKIFEILESYSTQEAMLEKMLPQLESQAILALMRSAILEKHS